DLILDGNDSLFIIETPTAGAVALRDCRRVTLRRFRFDYDPLPHSIGAVESINPAPAGAAKETPSTITLRRLPGYPDFDAPHMLANWSFGMILDPAIPGRVKSGSPLVVNFPGAKVTRHPADADLFSVGIPHANHGKFFAKGDRVIIFARNHGRGLCSANDGCDDITFDRVITHACPSAHFSGINTSDLKILSSGSKLKDATRFYAGNADGAHIRANFIGPWIEDCTFDSIGDDGVALYNKGMAIAANPAPGTLTVAGTFMNLRPGDAFVIFNPFDGQTIGATRTVTAVKPAANRQWDITFTPALESRPAFPMGDATWWKNTQLFNRTRVNAGFVVKNNTFTSVRRYSVIARSIDGVITGNTITGSSNAAITLLNEPHAWANGLHSERVLIARNKISASAFDASSTGAGSIVVNLRNLADASAEFRPKTGPAPLPARLHRDIRIENNTITDWNYRAILLRSATDCVIKGNTITAAPGAKFLAPDAPNIAILADNTRDCLITDNDTAGDPRLTSAEQRLAITNSDNTTAQNNRP
ncbi:MAG: right-handed parallel beta-helix repeat-containing protein, partial [Opitutaceae bacterium]|nr:right-handed parallel beta-helix repeat-containing protein [Opitutaceae bacterium]